MYITGSLGKLTDVLICLTMVIRKIATITHGCDSVNNLNYMLMQLRSF